MNHDLEENDWYIQEKELKPTTHENTFVLNQENNKEMEKVFELQHLQKRNDDNIIINLTEDDENP